MVKAAILNLAIAFNRASDVTVQNAAYKLVRLHNGAHVVHARDYDEKMHPGLGPAAEADLLYVRQLNIAERMCKGDEAFVVWDVGLGAAANAIAVLRATRDIARPLRLVSFDDTAQPLAFALANAAALGYLQDYESTAKGLLEKRTVEFQNKSSQVRWEFKLGDFPSWVANMRAVQVPDGDHAPHAILFDAFSPAKNPAMWILPLFTNLFRLLDPARPCALTTYSRSTMLRVTLLLAGFFVGRGVATGLKEETTLAANTLSLIDDPLDRRWLGRAHRSDSAEPLTGPRYRQSRLSEESLTKLQAHPQFK